MRLSLSALHQCVAISLLSTVLISCGGGGSSDSDGGTGTTPPPPPPPTSYLVTTNTTGSGTLSPTTASVLAGETAQFTASALTGYVLNTVTGCDGSLDGNTYTTGAINANCTVSAVFDQLQYNVTITLDGDPEIVLIDPDEMTVGYGDTAVVQVRLADEHLQIASLTGCPVESVDLMADTSSTYAVTVGPVVEDCELTVSVPNPTYNDYFYLDVDIFNGFSSYDGAAINYGERYQLTLIPYGDRTYRSHDIRSFGIENFDMDLSGCDLATWDQDTLTITIPHMNSNCQITGEFRSDDEFYFANNTLHEAVRDNLGLAAEELLTAAAVSTIETIDLPDSTNYYVTGSLAGLEAATALKTLHLSVAVNDLSALTGLPISDLELRMATNYIDTSVVEGTSHVPSLAPLATLPLTRLTLESLTSQANDYHELGNLSQLSSLRLAYNFQMNDISFVEQLPNLADLRLIYTTTMDLRPTLNSGLMNPYHYLYVYGCASLEQRVTQQVQQQLLAAGAQVNLTDTPSLGGECPSGDEVYQGSITGSLAAAEATVQWNFSRIDNGAPTDDVYCSVFANLNNEQPRHPDHRDMNCSDGGQVSFPRYFDHYNFLVQIDDGIYPPLTIGTTTVSDNSLEPNAQSLVSVEWGLVTFTSNPLLVPGRQAMIRAHVVGSSTVTPATMTLRLKLDGESTDITMTRPATLPQAANFQSLNASYRGTVPAEWMRDGLSIELVRNDQIVYQQTPQFDTEQTLYITVFPYTVNGMTTELPTNEALKAALMRHWPLHDVIIERAEPVIYDDNNSIEPVDLLYDLSARYNEDGAQHYYHGFFPIEAMDEDSNVAGVAFLGGNVGVTYDHPTFYDETFSHEMGHNFGLSHVGCGTSGDMRYPYPPDTTGSVGISANLVQIFPSTQYVDVMSYCSPEHVSDWSFNRVQDFFALNPPQSFTDSLTTSTESAGQPQQSTFIAGVIKPLGEQSKVLRAAITNHPAGAEKTGRFTLVATDRDGRSYERSFGIKQLPDAMSTRHGYFEVRVPAISIKRITVYEFGKEVFSAEL